jgi:hypothetical protein
MSSFPSLFDPLKCPTSIDIAHMQENTEYLSISLFLGEQIGKIIPRIYSTIGTMYQEPRTTGESSVA